MRSLQRRNWWRRIVYSKIFVGVLVIFALYMVSVVWGMYGKYQKTQENIALATTRFEEAKERKAHLSTKVKSLQTEQGVEAELRRKFLIAQEGEQVLVIINEDDEQKEGKEVAKDEKSWWESFLSLF